MAVLRTNINLFLMKMCFLSMFLFERFKFKEHIRLVVAFIVVVAAAAVIH